MAPKPQAPKLSDKTESSSQTSDDKSKPSIFGGSAAPTFVGFGSSKPSTSSPFGVATSNKLTSFAGSPGGPTKTSVGLGSGGFGGSTFGASSAAASGSPFTFGGPKSGLTSFASPSANPEIKGINTKDTPFGAPKLDEASDDDDDGEEDHEDADKEERQTSQPLLSQQRKFTMYVSHCDTNHIEAQETGEEGEDTIWTGRAKLYIMTGEPGSRAWKERGTGTFKFNVTVDAPKRARFVLRAEGTHRLLLNAAVTRNMTFGGDAQGEKPKDNRLLFNSPNADGEIEMHLLKVRDSRSTSSKRKPLLTRILL
jgi:Ran-binding protein 3